MNNKIYKRRTPEKSTLYKIVYNHFQECENIYPDKYEQDFGYLRTIIPKTIYKYLDCGILEHGFARVRCPQCGNDFFVAFSCKTRLFCPSCAEKRILLWAAWIKDNVLQNVPHRHWVFTIPRVLRRLFCRDRKLLAQLARCAAETIYELFHAVFPHKSFLPGFILSTQTFGDLLTWHPHTSTVSLPMPLLTPMVSSILSLTSTHLWQALSFAKKYLLCSKIITASPML